MTDILDILPPPEDWTADDLAVALLWQVLHRKLPKRRFWTAAELATLRRDYPGTPTADLAARLGMSIKRVYAKAKALGIPKSAAYLASSAACRLRRGDNVGKNTRFQKGLTPWNKGKHFIAGGRSGETRFKPGCLPHNTCEIGSYRFSKEGYLQRKIGNAKGSNSKRWRSVHELVWIEANGPVPEKHIVVFKPGMRTDTLDEITIDKVECISLVENMRRNTFHQYGPEIARIVQLRGAITRQINKRTSA